ADTLKVDRTAIQETPAMMLAARAVTGSLARPNRTMAIAVLTVPPAARTSLPNLALSQASAKLAATAPAPIAPSRQPYRPAPPAIWLRATSGSSAQYALANKKNAAPRIMVARRARLLRARLTPTRIAPMKRSDG